MEISVSSGLYYTKKYTEILDIISHTSCKNIELFFNQSFIDVKINELIKSLNRRDLNVLSLHTPLDFILANRNENEDIWLNRCKCYAKELDASLIVSHVTYRHNKNGQVENCDERHKLNMIEHCLEENIYVTTENMSGLPIDSFLQKPLELLNFLYENKCFITLDTSHLAALNIPLTKGYKIFQKFVKNIHISDFADGVEHKILGTGSLEFYNFLIQLKKDNYLGPLTIELDYDDPKRNNVNTIDDAILGIEQSIQQIKKTVGDV